MQGFRIIFTALIDERFLVALANGLPTCAGVDLGADRLVMAVLLADSLTDLLAVSIEHV